jgi:hypothetical protein
LLLFLELARAIETHEPWDGRIGSREIGRKAGKKCFAWFASSEEKTGYRQLI